MHSPSGRIWCMECRSHKLRETCDGCSGLMPKLPNDLSKLLSCFVMCESQLRATYGSYYALDYSTVIRVADSMGIVTNETFFNLLKSYERVLIMEHQDKMRREMKRNK